MKIERGKMLTSFFLKLHRSGTLTQAMIHGTDLMRNKVSKMWRIRAVNDEKVFTILIVNDDIRVSLLCVQSAVTLENLLRHYAECAFKHKVHPLHLNFGHLSAKLITNGWFL